MQGIGALSLLNGLATAARSASRTGLAAAFLRPLGLTWRMHGRRCVANLLPGRRGIGLCLRRKLLGIQQFGRML